jgi:hypothetical protein
MSCLTYNKVPLPFEAGEIGDFIFLFLNGAVNPTLSGVLEGHHISWEHSILTLFLKKTGKKSQEYGLGVGYCFPLLSHLKKYNLHRCGIKRQ